MNETNCSKFKKRAAALAVASCLSFAPWVAEAAGLGKLTVLSGLGQPLRAEMEIGASRDELPGMVARLAPEAAFRQAGVDFSSALLDLRFAVEKRPNGKSVVKVTSVRPVNEPFLDFLVELTWPSGRMVREYTFLLDPPEMAVKQPARPVVSAKVVETVPGGTPVEQAPVVTKPQPVAASPAPTPMPKPAAEPKPAPEGGRQVRPGETLRKIAAEAQYEGVSLEQMLVGIFQKNPDAFVGNNMNRLKSGAILGLPEKAEVAAISEAEARKVYVAQSSSWNAYREKLAATAAAAPAKTETTAQSSTGKITAKVEDKTSPAEQSKDKVKVSATEAAAVGKQSAQNEADRIAKEKALKEAQERLAILEKNVNDLQKLVEIKNQKLAELQKAPVKQEVPKPVEPPKPAEPVKPAEPPKAVEPPKVAEPPKVVEPPKPADAPVAAEPPKPVEEPKPVEAAPPPPPPPPVEAPKPVETKPTPPAQPAPPPPEPEEESSFMDMLPLVGGGGLIALLAGFFFYKRRRSSGEAVQTTTAPAPSSLGPNSVFRMTGGQSVDTGNTPPQTGDFSQTGPGTIDTDEVDPVAEADVYMAYGRDTQAEEILLEALQKDPQRTAIHAKLLEIYANRRSLKQFETLASELYAQTGGVGPEWEKVAALGADLDPGNPLYTGAKPGASAFDADATMIVTPDGASRATLAMPGAFAQMTESMAEPVDTASAPVFDNNTLSLPEAAEVSDAAVEPEAAESALDTEAVGLDFDLGSPALESAASAEEPYINTVVTPDSNALDFDLASEPAPSKEAEAPAEEPALAEDLAMGNVDFDLDISEPAASEKQPVELPDFSPEGTLVMPSAADVGDSTYVGLEGIAEVPSQEAGGPDEAPMVDFDLDIGASGSAASKAPEPPAMDREKEFDNPRLADTLVNPAVLDDDSLEFDVKLTDSVFLGQPMMSPEFDIGSINLDLAAEPIPAPAPTPLEANVPEVQPAAAAPAHDAHWDEVNTKLDLAKAYEEMGDLEGARELLQEVVSEGPVELVEQAKQILGRIGE